MKIEINGYPLHYETYGQGRPLFLLPGWSMSASDLAHITEPVFQNRSGWQRYYIDPPGHGHSPANDAIANLDDMLAMIIEALDLLSNGRSFLLYGYSLGAYLARGIIYHRFNLVNGLMMIAPVIISETELRNAPQHVTLIEEPDFHQQLQHDEKEMFSIAVVRSQQFLQYMRAFPQPAEGGMGDMDFLAVIRENPDGYKCSFNVDALSQPFPKPALIITGRQDSVVGFKDAWAILDNYPRATFVVFDRAGHFLEEKFELINSLFHEWLDRVEEYHESSNA